MCVSVCINMLITMSRSFWILFYWLPLSCFWVGLSCLFHYLVICKSIMNSTDSTLCFILYFLPLNSIEVCSRRQLISDWRLQFGWVSFSFVRPTLSLSSPPTWRLDPPLERDSHPLGRGKLRISFNLDGKFSSLEWHGNISSEVYVVSHLWAYLHNYY